MPRISIQWVYYYERLRMTFTVREGQQEESRGLNCTRICVTVPREPELGGSLRACKKLPFYIFPTIPLECTNFKQRHGSSLVVTQSQKCVCV